MTRHASPPLRRGGRRALAAAAVLLGVAALGWRAAVGSAPTRAIEQLIRRAARAVERENLLALSAALAIDYTDDSGLDRTAALGLARQFFAEADELRVEVARIVHEDPDLPRTAEQAQAVVVARVSGVVQPGGERFSGIVGRGVDAVLVRVAKRGREWKIVSTRRLTADDPEALREALRE